ncbi:DUF1553 domain-containing protein [Humisphaera borealis]|uniref:PSD1 domain-containing protein n=1 Tax=Humisphaera borealis TaxID=2807512 RepID=A0A7M2WVL5_9BACT|nr:DUF1553 domain-containing protein [Humisphaera borealis]QOV89568.1 PSD1 domain-containing protein [Humisphaera borealis]
MKHDLFTISRIACMACIVGMFASSAAAQVDFDREIRPILENRCVECHGEKKQKGDLRLDTKSHASKGGENGAVIVAGKSVESALFKRVASANKDEVMPPNGEPLSAAQIVLIKRWIDSGAVWPESAADQAASVDKRLQHWAWQPIRRPANGRCVDDFITAKLAETHLTLSAPADARTLVRRMYFDVTGLPPTPEQLESAIHDPQSEIEKLLASRRFGEKWARHWLDVVRFAESDGFEMNRARANAWPYRDYVIAAFNDDKPYDQFIREQLAGDAFNADAATGFLVGGGKDRVGSNDPVLTTNQRADELHDMVSTTAATFLGITLNCARCHDHKFDPIPTKDYYGFVGMLQGVQHGERLWRMSVEAPEKVEEKQSWPAVVAGRNDDNFPPTNARFVRFTITACSSGEPCIDELEVFNTDGENVARGAKVTVSGTFANGTNANHQAKFLNDGQYGNARSWISERKGGGTAQLEFANTEQIDHVSWSRDRSEGGPKYKDRLATGYHIDVSDDGKSWRTVSSDKRRANSAPKGPQVYAGTFQMPGPTRRNHRGDPMQPREEVTPAVLSMIGKPMALPGNEPEQKRRLALANWIASADNPLTARVIVNRLWHYHFGTGLVDTPSDYGINGSRPTHPELLDFLASELITHGWSLKHVHRLILNSKTYQQSSAFNEVAARVDSNTRLLWRFPPRRLDAEAVRDAMLAVSGKLDLTMGGPGFDLFERNDNYVKVYVTKAECGPAEFRRMVYQSKPRTMLDDFLGAFDCPDAGQPQPKRTSSTTPLQALNLLNSNFSLQQSTFLAERLKQEAGGDVTRQIERAFALMFQRKPTAEELRGALALVKQHGLPALCRALYNTNEFIRLN